jgi:hypothetical protein
LEKPVGEKRGVAGAESGWHEAGALDADAPLHGWSMAGDHANPAGAVDGQHGSLRVVAVHYSGDILNRTQCPGSRRSARRTGRGILHSVIES